MVSAAWRGRQGIFARLSFARFRFLLHLFTIVALIGTLLIAQQAESYFTRGVATPEDLALIPWTDGPMMGINTFLNEEADPAIVERSLDMIADGGYGYIRQLFGWFEIEPAPGVYVDQFGNSTWEKYDRIVDLAYQRGIEVVARLDKPPVWARAAAEYPEVAGPPDRLGDFGNFVTQVVSRYQGKVRFVQIWNEPNLEGEWGRQPIDPAGYVELLKVGYEAAKGVDPNVVVLMAGLAPTDQRGPYNLSDLLFLQQVYDHGGAAWFDIAAVMVYGYGYSPDDRRLGFARNNFSRPVQTREIMERNGDAATPIWAVEYGWVSLPENWDGESSPWGEPISEERRAEYLVEGYLRAQREWPWMGMMAVWSFRFPRPADAPDQIGNPTRGFTIVDFDFEPKPAYQALKRAAGAINRMGTGAYLVSPTQADELTVGNDVRIPMLGDSIAIDMVGTGTLVATTDGGQARRLTVSTGGKLERRTLFADLDDGPHVITLRFEPGPSPDALSIERYVVWSESVHLSIYRWIDTVLVATLLLNLVSLGWAVAEGKRNNTGSA